MYGSQNEHTDLETDLIPEIATYDFPNGDLHQLKDKLKEINWDDHIDTNMTPSQILSSIVSNTLLIAKQVKVPQPIYSQPNSIHPPAHRKRLFNKRCKLQNKQKFHPRQRDKIVPKINIINDQLQESYRQQKILTESKAIESIKVNSSYFYKYANSKRKVRNQIGPLKISNNGKTHLEYGPDKMAEIFSQQFTSVFAKPDETKVVHDPTIFFYADMPIMTQTLSDLQFSMDDIQSA